ncbi:MAG: glycosyltransferase family 1 protein [Victivallaceae bacterium]|jgi:glycosyltransferase involved in cell wall biosynthesis
MRIAIEATLAQGKATGFGQYVINLLHNFAAMKTGHEFLLFHSTPKWTGPDFGPGFKPVSYFYAKQSLGIMFRLNRELERQHADIFHATCTTGMPPRISIPAVSTICDIYPLLHPEGCSFLQMFFFKFLLRWTIKNSNAFICISEFTASELRKYLAVPADKIAVTLLAPANSGPVTSELLPEMRDGIICVGAIEPRKNQLMLLAAYRQALAIQPAMPRLTFIGPDRGDGARLDSYIKTWKLSDKVRHLDYVSADELERHYRHAALFVFPTTYEGFGIPLLEAVRYDLPVLCSDIPVLREIGDDYPVFLNPDDVNDWSMAMIDFFFGELKNSFNYKSPESILMKFSWRRCAEQTLEIYSKLYNETN